MIIASWNVLTNKVRPEATASQAERLGSLTQDISTINPDILGLCEVDRDIKSHWGDQLPEHHVIATDYEDPKYGFSLLLASKQKPANTKTIRFDMPDRRTAIMSQIGGVTVVATHFSFRLERFDWRRAQTRHVLRELEGEDAAVIMADFNSFRWQKPRRMLLEAGFQSVASLLEPAYPPTFPNPKYYESLRLLNKIIAARSMNIDDIYFRNMNFKDGGLIKGESDHHGIWAELDIV